MSSPKGVRDLKQSIADGAEGAKMQQEAERKMAAKKEKKKVVMP